MGISDLTTVADSLTNRISIADVSKAKNADSCVALYALTGP
jgi:hypothetical protein